MGIANIPLALENENILIATLLNDFTVFIVAQDIIEAKYFFSLKNQTIWKAIQEVAAHTPEYDVVMVGDHLKKEGLFDSVGGYEGLQEIVNSNTWDATESQFEYHVNSIREAYIRREAYVKSAKFTEDIKTHTGDFQSFTDKFEQDILGLFNTIFKKQEKDIATILGEIISKAEKKQGHGLQTRYAAFNEMTRGFQPSQLYIIAARPSVGKSSLAMNLAEDFCKEEKRVAFFSIEMSRRDILEKFIASMAEINTKVVSSGMNSEAVTLRAIEASGIISDFKLYLDDTSEITVNHIQSKCRRIIQMHGPLDAIFIDYLQLMRSDDMRMPREERVSNNSRLLKVMAKNLDVPVIVMAQLNRDSEKRDHKRPRLSDLRESGAIEQDADVVMLIHRHGFTDGNNKGETELIVAKNRHGETGTIYLDFVGEYVTFKPDRAKELEMGL